MIDMNLNANRLFATDVSVSNNSFQTGLNNNDLIIGPSGSGKTTGYVIPNINQHYGSYIVADTKGNLAKKLEPSLRKAGYRVYTLDFVDMDRSCRYNPMDYIRNEHGRVNEQDIIRIATLLSPVRSTKDPFWEEMAQQFLMGLIALVMEDFPKNEQNIVTVSKLFKMMDAENITKMISSLEVRKPDCFASKVFRSVVRGSGAWTTWDCIMLMLSRSLRLFDMKSFEKMSCNVQRKFDFERISNEPSVLFVNVSDTDRSMDSLVNLFYYQAFQQLCAIADKKPDSRLNIPVQFILDDFATNCVIPDFDKTISVIRSRGISASLIIQSITQLTTLYGPSAASTILNNCDHTLYLGGQDLETAHLIAARINKCPETVLALPQDKAYFIERGGRCGMVDKINPFIDKLADDDDDVRKHDTPDNSVALETIA